MYYEDALKGMPETLTGKNGWQQQIRDLINQIEVGEEPDEDDMDEAIARAISLLPRDLDPIGILKEYAKLRSFKPAAVKTINAMIARIVELQNSSVNQHANEGNLKSNQVISGMKVDNQRPIVETPQPTEQQLNLELIESVTSRSINNGGANQKDIDLLEGICLTFVGSYENLRKYANTLDSSSEELGILDTAMAIYEIYKAENQSAPSKGGGKKITLEEYSEILKSKIDSIKRERMNYLAGFNLKSDKIRGVLDKFLVLSTEKYDKMEKLDWGFLKDQVVDITKGNPTQKEFENTVGLLRQHISSESYSTADFEKFAMLAPEPDKSNKVQSGKLNTVITILAMFAVNDTREIDQQIARIRDKRDKKIAANSNNLPKRSASSGISKLSKADLILQGKLNQSYRMPLAGEADLDLIDRRVKAISNSILETVLKNPNLKVSVIKHLESQAERNLDMSILAPQLALLPQDAKKTRLEAATRNINEINDNTRFRDIAPERRQSLLLSHHNR